MLVYHFVDLDLKTKVVINTMLVYHFVDLDLKIEILFEI